MKATPLRRCTNTTQRILSRRANGLAAGLGCLFVALGTGFAQPILQFTAGSYGVSEAAGTLTLTVQRLNDPRQCAPSEPVSILHIHGSADARAPYRGCGATPVTTGFPWNATPTQGAPRAAQTWASYNGALGPVTDPAPTLDLVLDVRGLDTILTRYTNAPPNGAVELWTIVNGPHRPVPSAEFSPRVIDWLLAHPKP